MNSVIVGTGSYVPPRIIPNDHFLTREFYNSNGERNPKNIDDIIDKFEEITHIRERRWVEEDLVTSDIAHMAAKDALDSSGIKREDINYIVVAHNFGDVKEGERAFDMVPSHASRVKYELKIKDPNIIACDIICEGSDRDQEVLLGALNQGSIALVIGAETLARFPNPYDITGMACRIFENGQMTTHKGPLEDLDNIIVAHNLGRQMVPSIASAVQRKLEMQNAVAYDIIFGCAGWLQGVIQADHFLKVGEKALVIGAEALSRVSDPHDVDSMMYADGAAAVVLQGTDGSEGLLSHASITDADLDVLRMGTSYNPNYKGDQLFLKMNGHDLYKYVLREVPRVIRTALEKASLELKDVSKLYLHQANGKMDEGVLRNLHRLYGIEITRDMMPEVKAKLMPMTVEEFGNPSGASIPTLADRISKGKIENHSVSKGDIILMAAMGAGTSINAVVYRVG